MVLNNFLKNYFLFFMLIGMLFFSSVPETTSSENVSGTEDKNPAQEQAALSRSDQNDASNTAGEKESPAPESGPLSAK